LAGGHFSPGLLAALKDISSILAGVSPPFAILLLPSGLDANTPVIQRSSHKMLTTY
jgi:hypothetical protein